jgi:hypothetical protein
MEAPVFQDGNAAAHNSNGLTEKRYREANEEERATYRRWTRGVIVFYSVLALATGLLAAVNYTGAGLTQLTHLSVRPVATSPRAE